MQSNIDAIVNYFMSGIKNPDDTERLGVELEHIVVDEHSGPIPYSDEHGSRWVLEHYSADLPRKTLGTHGELIGVANADMALSLEPAAQLELSAGPFEYVNEIRPTFERFQRKATSLLAPFGQRIVAVGYHPQAKADDLELIPKRRYQFMDAHFQAIGPYGRRMMRGSAATQISIDYHSIDDCLRKLRIASGLAPLFALVCDNTPFFEGAPRPHQLVRTKIWRECDPQRCGLVPGVMDPDFSLERYASYVLRTPAIFALDAQGRPFATEKTFGELYGPRGMRTADVEHALSLFFNDVRLKTYIEIRPADSMPTPFVAAYAALVKGLFYNSASLDELDELLAGIDASAVDEAKTELMAHGYEARVYNRPAAELVDELFALASKGLSTMEKGCLMPLSQLVAQRKTLASMAERSRKEPA